LRKQLRRGRFPCPPVMGRFDGKRLFEYGQVQLMLMARRIEHLLTSRRLQAQLFMLVVAAFLAGLTPMLYSGLTWGERPKIPGSGVFVAL